jgi:hypothetical protein
MDIRKNLQKQIKSIFSNVQNMWLIFAGLFMTIFTMNFIIYGFFILTIALVFFYFKKCQIDKLVKEDEGKEIRLLKKELRKTKRLLKNHGEYQNEYNNSNK